MYRKLLVISIVALTSNVADASDCINSLTSDEEKSLEIEFFNAINSRNTGKINSMLKQYPGIVNIRDKLGQTPLIHASIRGDFNTVKTLMEFESNDKRHVLLISDLGDENVDLEISDISSIQLPQYADVNIVDDFGRNALMWASHLGYDDIVSFFIDEGSAIMNTEDLDQMTALSLAVRAQHHSIVKILLQPPKMWKLLALLGVDGFENFKSTINNGIDNMIIDINSRDSKGLTPLLHAVKNNDIEMVKTLIENDAGQKMKELLSSNQEVNSYIVEALARIPILDVNKNMFGDDDINPTPLMVAVSEGYLGIVKLLLDHPNINVNAEDLFGQTALMYAAVSDIEYPEIVELLLERTDVEVNKTDSVNEQTALIYAIQAQNRNVIHLLLNDEDINVNVPDEGGLTPLHWACIVKDYETLAALLSRSDIDTSIIDLNMVTHNDIERFLAEHKQFERYYTRIAKAWSKKTITPLTIILWAYAVIDPFYYTDNSHNSFEN